MVLVVMANIFGLIYGLAEVFNRFLALAFKKKIAVNRTN
jgi:hypothetical protein